MPLESANDHWDPNGDEPYATLKEFLAMCADCHGCVPVLVGDDDDGYRYESGPHIGEYVLVPVADDDDDDDDDGSE